MHWNVVPDVFPVFATIGPLATPLRKLVGQPLDILVAGNFKIRVA